MGISDESTGHPGIAAPADEDPARRRRRVVLVAVGLGLLVSIPALFVGFAHDDLLHRLWLDGHYGPEAPGRFGLYNFTSGTNNPAFVDRGLLPWLAHDSLKLWFLRPLSSFTLALDHDLFGRNALLAHAHSLLWLGVLLACVGSLYARWFEPRRALLCAVIFAIAGAHGMPTAWLAARHTLVAAALGAVALWSWVRFREDGWGAGRFVTFGAAVLALLSSETGLVGLLFLFAYELGRQVALRERWVGAASFAVLGLVYLVSYAALGYGARGSAMYVSPFSDPVGYLGQVLLGVPVLLGEAFGGLPSMLVGPEPALAPGLAVLGVVAVLTVVGLVFARRRQLTARERRTLTWLGAASIVSPVLLVGTTVSGRVLPFVLVGASAVVGHAIALSWRAIHQGRGQRWLLFAPVVLLALLHLVFSPLIRVVIGLQFAKFAEASRLIAERADLKGCAGDGVAYLLTASDPTLSIYAKPAVDFYTPSMSPRRLRALSLAPHDQELKRIAPNAFELRILDLPRRTNDFERIYRPEQAPLREGDTVHAEELSVKVLDTSEGAWTRASFELDEPVDAENVCLLTWRDGRLQKLPVPPVGGTIAIPHEVGPLGL